MLKITKIMDHLKNSMLINKKAQSAPVSPTAAPTTAVTLPPTNIDIRTVPNFRPELFSAKPDIINDLNHIVNIINKNLVTLSVPQGSISFSLVWTNPSVSGSGATNSVKNLLNLAKWIYNVIKSRAQPYSLDGLKAIGTGLITTVKSYSFPEPSASSVQAELVTAGQLLLAKLG